MNFQYNTFVKNTIVLLLFIIITSSSAYAKRVGGLFGTDENIEKIKDIELKGSNGEDLYLAYKTTSTFFIFGVYFSDDGYVLGIKKSYGSYYPLDDEMIKTLQASGQLDTPLPEYDIPIFDRVFGFSLWILLPFLLLRFLPLGKSEDSAEYKATE